MAKIAAIVAHFDAENQLDENFKISIASLESVADTILLVTTSDLASEEVELSSKVRIIKRPNFGYDFYSYKVGITLLRQDPEVSYVFLVNSSFIVIDPNTFISGLRSMLARGADTDIVGYTLSKQISWHLQSYLLLLNRQILDAAWFINFFDDVQPSNTKFEIIVSYEIGLSTTALMHGATLAALFQPSISQRWLAQWRWMKIVSAKSRFGWLSLQPIKHRHEVNWTHFCAEPIARQFGIVKTEVLRNNPHRVTTTFVQQLGSPEILTSIDRCISKSRRHYRSDARGLTTLANEPLSPRVIRYANLNTQGVRIAVVVHLFYADLFDETLSYLKNIIEPFDLFVTTPFERDIPFIINRGQSYAHSITVYLYENRGRDIGPFTDLFRRGVLDRYLAVLKLHSKKSKYSAQGDAWRRAIYGELAGNSLTIRRGLALFDQGNVGLLGPHQFYLSHRSFWGANKDRVGRLLVCAGALQKDTEAELGFFAGSMFWFSPKALSALKDIPASELTFDLENGAQDGTLAHAVERIFCGICLAAGYNVTSLQLAGLNFSAADTQKNRVPVL